MYYTSGNYEAFARPRKPAGADSKTAWFVGSGLAALSGAAFLIRDGQMRGDRITILERQTVPGGRVGRLSGSEKRIRDSRWQRDGGSFRVSLGSVSFDPIART
ncbi:oleate hydratase [Bradyrhizobium sp. BRP20]|nr:oleate hydratase [Bradyrhizobium sp. IC3123]MCA1437278.1 oleate hydratase [Bradyrhizobium sp. BRP20]MCA1472584.1 oleate hydratase [Bradyrhizobium sp. IC3195]MCA1551364.1 oleate hydratase [Bradyrhizobium sp. BRP19]